MTALGLLLAVAWVTSVLAAQAGMREAEEVLRQEHLKAMRWRP